MSSTTVTVASPIGCPSLPTTRPPIRPFAGTSVIASSEMGRSTLSWVSTLAESNPTRETVMR